MPQPVDLGTILSQHLDEGFEINDTSEIPDNIIPKAGQLVVNRATGDIIITDGLNSWGTVKKGFSGTYTPADATTVITRNSDSTIASVTTGGILTTYTRNTDGSIASHTRLGVTRTYTRDTSGNLTGIV